MEFISRLVQFISDYPYQSLSVIVFALVITHKYKKPR